MKSNGCCEESGYDLYEQQVKKEFIESAPRYGLKIETNIECPWEFEDSKTNLAWKMYHIGHVRGRTFMKWRN